jgi:hypothetical protein
VFRHAGACARACVRVGVRALTCMCVCVCGCVCAGCLGAVCSTRRRYSISIFDRSPCGTRYMYLRLVLLCVLEASAQWDMEKKSLTQSMFCKPGKK